MGTEEPQGGPPKSGYGAKWKKWLLIYLAVGIVAYALIYFVFFAGNGYGGGSGY